MKQSHLRHIKRVGILLCLLLVLCSAEYLIGESDPICPLALPSMPSKAVQKKLKAQVSAKRRVIRKKMEEALYQVQLLDPYLFGQFGQFKHYTKQRCALCFKSASYEYKKEMVLGLKKELLKKNIHTKKKLVRAIQNNQWLEQARLCKSIELINALTFLSTQKDIHLKNKLAKVYTQANSIQKRLSDLHASICKAEKKREYQLSLAERYAQRLVSGKLAISTELFSVIPPVQPLDEI